MSPTFKNIRAIENTN